MQHTPRPVEPLRIVIVTHRFPLAVEPFLTVEVTGLIDRGHRVCVISRPGDTHLDRIRGDRPSNTLRLRHLPSGSGATKLASLVSLLMEALATDARSVRRLAVALRRDYGHGRHFCQELDRCLRIVCEAADLVHFEFADHAAEYADVLPLLPMPKVVTCRGDEIRIYPRVSEQSRERMSRALSRVDRVICVSEEMAGLARTYGADPARTVVIRSFVDARFFRPPPGRADHSNGIRLVSVGRLHWVKGYEYALEAVGRLRDRGCRLTYTIVGPDEGAGAALAWHIRDRGLADVVSLVGQLDQGGVWATLSRADIFLLSSVSEGLCIAALEAMAMGLPIVSTNVGGMPEAIETGVHGLLVPARDPVALAEAVERLAADPNLRRAMGAQGSARVRKEHDPDTYFERLQDVYREVTRA